jgi:peptidoglycan/xylan/chitin deacetylase (PgdA/CDA1 family)
MSKLRYAAIRAAFEVLWASQLPALVRRFSSTKGVIFTLHRVLPEPPATFAPNAILQVTPDFLRFAIERVRTLGLEVVTLDEAVTRIQNPERTKPFAVFTFDDGYRDNRDHALPVLRSLGAPFTLYIPTALVDGVGEIWWQALEDVIRTQPSLEMGSEARVERLDTGTLEQKEAVYADLYARMRTMPEPDRVTFIRTLCTRYGIDLDAHCRSLIMSWNELQPVAADPLCTIGAHTVHHYELSKLPEDKARAEIVRSADIIEGKLGKRPAHLSYPIGSPVAAGEREYAIAKALGFRSAVTTRPGGLYHRHAQALHELPRISLNGLYQERRYMDVFGTPAVFSLLAK